jgi:hypothetical protein
MTVCERVLITLKSLSIFLTLGYPQGLLKYILLLLIIGGSGLSQSLSPAGLNSGPSVMGFMSVRPDEREGKREKGRERGREGEREGEGERERDRVPDKCRPEPPLLLI